METQTPVWDSLHMLFLDTDPRTLRGHGERVCTASPNNSHELEAILYNELLLALRANLSSVAGAWCGFDPSGLIEHVPGESRTQQAPPTPWTLNGQRILVYGVREMIADRWDSTVAGGSEHHLISVFSTHIRTL